MDTFHWDKNFETGLDEVDEQHHTLVNLINRFGELLLTKNDSTFGEIGKVFSELAAYTQYHFKEEEALMYRVGLDSRFIEPHIQFHAEFLREAVKMHNGITPQNMDAAKPMLKYLVHWLAFHILGVDQSMSRQMAAIRHGQAPSAIYLDEARITKVVTEPLLLALDGLFQQVSAQNSQLLELNQTLEVKVTERTRSLSEANQQLEEMALTDVLTGLPNRRHAMARLAKEWADSIKEGTPLACMMIDADGFKQINDTYGHDAGDEVLRQLSRHLRYAVRTDDVVCRLGGDEFLIICANTSQSGALQVAETMRKAVSELRVPAGIGEWKGSVSVGVAARTQKMKSIEDLVKVADDGVYLAKRNGRNCVACRNAE
jgi:hemerythrin